MKKFFTTSLGQFRLIAFLEGISYLVLLGICMPMKYFADIKEPVYYVGRIHGGLVILYLLALVKVHFEDRWSIKKSLLAFVASLIPFGNFIFEMQVLRKEKEAEEVNS